MSSTNIPRIVTKFFEMPTNDKHLKNFDIEILPWLPLNIKYEHCEQLIELTKQIQPHTRYFTTS